MNVLLSSNPISYIDIILLCFLGAYLIGGIIKGFANYLVGFIGTVAAFILAVIFCDDMVKLLEPTPLYESVRHFFEGLFPVNDGASLESLGLPSFVKDAVNALRQATPNLDLSKAVSTALTNLLLTFVCFLIILFGVKLICFILKKILKALNEIFIIGTVNRILGGIVGLINGALFLTAIMYLISILPIPALESFKAVLNASPVAGFLNKYNIYVLLFSIF